MPRIYEDYIIEIKGLKEAVSRRDSGSLNVSIEIRFKNDPWQTYSRLVELGEVYPFEGSSINIYEVYRDDEGGFYTDESEARDRLRAEIFQVTEIQMEPSGPLLYFTTSGITLPDGAAKVLLFSGVLDQPKDNTLMEFKCLCSSEEYHLNRLFKQSLISQDDYSNALQDVGKVIPIIYGSGFMVPALRVDWGARSTLTADIDEDDTSLTLADASQFPTSGSIIVNIEQISYTGKSGNTLTGLTRGVGTTEAAIHGAGGYVLEDKAYYRSILADHELKAVDSVWAELPDGRLVKLLSGYSVSVLGGRQVLDVDSDASFDVDEEVNVSAANVDAGSDQYTTPYTSLPLLIQITSITQTSLSGAFNTPSQPDGKLYNTYSEINWSANNNSDGVYRYYIDGKLIAELQPGSSSGGTILVTGWPLNISWQILRVTAPTAIIQVQLDIQSGLANATRLSNTKIGSQARVVRYHAIVDGYKDTTGDYGGIGNVIERPDQVMKHFLVVRLGFALSSIDLTSFNAAGALYAAAISGGYKLAFSLDAIMKFASRAARGFATESRSVLYMSEGKWELDFLPDVAPAADHDVAQTELAGDNALFKFSATSSAMIINYYEANFARNYTRVTDDSEWDGNTIESDAASIIKYSERREKIDFKYVRLLAMVTDVLELYLKQKSGTLRNIDFEVYFDRFEIEIGDTIEIESDLYDGEKYFIEEVTRTEKEKARIKGLQWW
jgi:hypothetical protein